MDPSDLVEAIRAEQRRYENGLLPFAVRGAFCRILKRLPDTHPHLTPFERGYFLGLTSDG